ncbi:asparagine synthase-related protein [Paucidesulfovibrio longus]|uniref:asparagine synthase-related protein n=1 Tax=Paucidesulfovibrio longus TaxID=889 RepID=UPI0003F71372|nr:asparagine synthase-related protein [Paucidesulfovibrio longus]
MSVLGDRLEQLFASLDREERVAVLLSGGVDSAVVAACAFAALGGRAVAVTLRSEFTSGCDAEWAARIAAHIGIAHLFGRVRLLDDPGILAHESDRCLRCKRILCAQARQLAPDALLLDGTNADDDPARPGRRALREYHVRSPLEECGLGKHHVRELAENLGLPNANRPSNSCLATRLIAGRVIRREDLARVARVEEVLREEGFEDVRARLDDLKMILEIPFGSEPLLEKAHARIMQTIKGLGLTLAGYVYRASGENRT